MEPGRLIQYSLTQTWEHPRPDLLAQFAWSVQTLRAHNRGIPAVLFLHSPVTAEIAAICRDYDVLVHEQGPYEERLAALAPAGWPAIATYPLLHKFLNFSTLAALGPTAVLCCDVDTVFRGDPGVLFDRYGGADIVAREEVHSRRSAYGADETFIDESLLAELAVAERAARIPPFNLGVVLFADAAWRALASLEALFVDYAWRFVSWMAQHPAAGLAAAYGEFAGVSTARALVKPVDVARALPYPSANRWILDEVALWLTLGHLRGIRTADFHSRDVAQNGEFARADARAAEWIVCHYFSQNLPRIGSWLRGSEREVVGGDL